MAEITKHENRHLPVDYAECLKMEHKVSENAKKFKSFLQKGVEEDLKQNASNEKLFDQLDGWGNEPTVAQVFSLQILLFRLGFNSESNIDGIYANKSQQGIKDSSEIKLKGSEIQKAVLHFQEKFGCKEDGQFGPETLAALKKQIEVVKKIKLQEEVKSEKKEKTVEYLTAGELQELKSTRNRLVEELGGLAYRLNIIPIFDKEAFSKLGIDTGEIHNFGDWDFFGKFSHETADIVRAENALFSKAIKILREKIEKAEAAETIEEVTEIDKIINDNSISKHQLNPEQRKELGNVLAAIVGELEAVNVHSSDAGGLGGVRVKITLKFKDKPDSTFHGRSVRGAFKEALEKIKKAL